MTNPINDWKYYNHGVVSSKAPHEIPNLSPIEDGSIWHIDGKHPLMVRYTTDWDCGYDTGWWYCIKDTPFDISALKTKRRYEITKALRFFEVKEINPVNYCDAMANVQKLAYSAYPPKYRPVFNSEVFKQNIEIMSKGIDNGKLKVFGAFCKQTNVLAGYSCVNINSSYLAFSYQRAIPAFEKNNVNAALVYGILETFGNVLSKNYYISDGSRSINHETHFQDYLEKYFGFRKCYCKLHTNYPLGVKALISLIFPLRNCIHYFSSFSSLHKISAILKMEEIARLNK